MENNYLPDFADYIPESEYSSPGFFSLFRIIWASIRNFFKEKPGIIIVSSIILLMLWGGKPVPELFGTLIWGLAAGASAYAVRSIWPVVMANWLLNVISDSVLSNLF